MQTFPYKKIIPLLLAAALLPSCGGKKIKNGERSFCYWKTSLGFSAQDDSLMQATGNKHFYLRFFDVDWNPYQKEARPVATLDPGYQGVKQTAFTPSIFITNAVFENSSKPQLDSLAARLWRKTNGIIRTLEDAALNNAISAIMEKRGLAWDKREALLDSLKPSETAAFRKGISDILIDCDWTQGTKDNYFYFLEKLKAQAGFPDYKLSVSVRLWQFKNADKAGVPAADRALLMCYNLGSPKNPGDVNSIGSADALEDYLGGDKYPIAVDIALPIFHWAVLFRGDKYKGIVSGMDAAECIADTSMYQQKEENRFVFKKDRVMGDLYVRNGDELRMERVSDKELEKIIGLLSKKVDFREGARVSFFSWDKKYIDLYGTANIQKYYSSLGL